MFVETVNQGDFTMPTIIHFRWTRLATLAAVVCVGAGLTHSSTAEALSLIHI